MRRNTALSTPWSRSGLMHHPGHPKHVNGERTWPDVAQWRDNPVFSATIKLNGTERGRSAAFFRWTIVETPDPVLLGQELPMFITDVGILLMEGLPQPGGLVTAEFFVVKRGQNYGVTPVVPEPETPARGHERPTEDLELPAGAPPPAGHP